MRDINTKRDNGGYYWRYAGLGGAIEDMYFNDDPALADIDHSSECPMCGK